MLTLGIVLLAVSAISVAVWGARRSAACYRAELLLDQIRAALADHAVSWPSDDDPPEAAEIKRIRRLHEMRALHECASRHPSRRDTP